MILPLCAALLCFGVCLPLFLHYKKALRPVLGALFKCTGTACALVLALIAGIRLNPTCFLCAGALLLHLTADYLIEFSLPLGSAFFGAGHLLYIAYFVKTFSLSLPAWICFAILVTALAVVLYLWRSKVKNQMLMFSVYGVLLSAMTAAGVGCGLPHASLQGALTAAGAAIFYVSDLLLLQRLLFRTGRLMPWLVMITYYAAQLLLASACLLS